MSEQTAYSGADIFDGHKSHAGASLLIRDGCVEGVLPAADLPLGCRHVAFEGGLIIPGLVDLQVNGGGGVMLNNAPGVDTIRIICDAHARRGTTALLPTLITDTPDVTRAAMDAAREAHAQNVPGMIGLHLEGPHLARSRKGAHSAELIRPMEEQDCRMLEELAAGLPGLLVTVAPESVTPEQTARLTKAGVSVSLGHSDCTCSEAMKLSDSGASCVTHLFNAMSQLTGREPGLVGAALNAGSLSAGLIADGYHVDPAAVRIAMQAKKRPGRIFLVSDAMAVTGTDLSEFFLNGRRILRRKGRLTLEDGTLAGADLDLFTAVLFMQRTMGLEFEEAVRMATVFPAAVLGRNHDLGNLKNGARADFVWLRGDGRIGHVYRRGDPVPPDDRLKPDQKQAE